MSSGSSNAHGVRLRGPRTETRRAARRSTGIGPPLMGALMRLATQRVRRQMIDAVRAAGFDDLQDAHLSLFHYPGPDGLRPSDLARQLHTTRQATNHLLAQLEALGYLERRSGPDEDRRRVYLTPRGARLVAAIRSAVRTIERDWERVVGPARFKAFVEVLKTMSSR